MANDGVTQGHGSREAEELVNLYIYVETLEKREEIRMNPDEGMTSSPDKK